MPRECLHWSVAEQAHAQLREANISSVVDCIDDNWGAMYVGAMLPDAFYYHRFGRSPCSFVAEYLHGAHGNDTFAAVRALLEVSARSSYSEYRPKLHALCLGVLTHIATDVVFHPMVFYTTGNYYDHNPVERKNSRTRHRLFETYLDTWAERDHRERLRTVSISEALRSSQGCLAVFSHALQYALSPKVIADAQGITLESAVDGELLWKEALLALSTLQGMFRNPFLGGALRLINTLSLGSLRPIDALAAFGRGHVPAAFEGEISYRNPVSGDAFEKSLEELWRDAVALTADWWTLLQNHVDGSMSDNESLLAGLAGPSLNFGEVGARVDEALYFSEHGFDCKGLKYGTY